MKTDKSKAQIINNGGPCGFVFFVAFIGAAVYFVHQSSGFWGFILAILKAIVWPAYAVYHGLMLLGA